MVFLTWRWESEPVEIRPGESRTIASLPYCLISLLFGWWGLPWGIFLTPVVIWRNLRGGRQLAESEEIAAS
jgi:uncharacterized Tic20 family protein